MHTQRLATMMNPAHIERLLDSYVSGSGALPDRARKRDRWDSLPIELRRFAAQAFSDGYVCSVWSDGETVWFFAGSLVLDRAREFGRPVLEVHWFDDLGHARNCVLTEQLPDGSWSHCMA